MRSHRWLICIALIIVSFLVATPAESASQITDPSQLPTGLQRAIRDAGLGEILNDPGSNGGGAAPGTEAAFVASDPCQTQTLVGPDTDADDNFGHSVAMDGNSAIIGARDKEGGGAAYVFTENMDGLWVFQAKLTPPGDAASPTIFGHHVDIDGNRAAVSDALSGPNGEIYVFDRTGDDWSHSETLIGPLGPTRMGNSLALTGNYIFSGDHDYPVGGQLAGAVHVYRFIAGIWVLSQTLVAPVPEENDFFGTSVAAQGTHVLVGASGDDDVAENAGAIYPFALTGTGAAASWQPFGKLTAADGLANSNLGFRVTLDGEWAAATAIGDPGPGNSTGSVYVYQRLALWTQRQKIQGDASRFDAHTFGEEISLQGSDLIVDTGCDCSPQFAHHYRRSGTNWTLRTNFQVSTFGDVAVNRGTFLYGQEQNSGTTRVYDIQDSDGDRFENSCDVCPFTSDPDQSNLDGDAFGDDCDNCPINFDNSQIDNDGDGEGNICDIDDDDDNVGDTIDTCPLDPNPLPDNDPAVCVPCEEQQLVPDDGVAGAKFGGTVSIDGDTALVGAVFDTSNGTDAGAAYVFVRSGTTWTQQAKLLPDDGEADDEFGDSVSLDGDTALIGARTDDELDTQAGSAYVFVRSGTSWTQQAKLLASDGSADDNFGDRVALSGNTALIAAQYDGDNGDEAGAAYIFVRSGSNWTQRAKLLATDGAADDNFGRSLALDGNTAVIGAPNDGPLGDESGSVYVFVGAGSNWTQQAKLQPLDGDDDDNFGRGVAVSGNTILVGAPDDEERLSTDESGSAYVFVRSGGIWTQQAKLFPPDPVSNMDFGFAVALDGDVALVGAMRDDELGDSSGSAYVYVRTGTEWVLQSKLYASDGDADDRFGFAVDLDGGTALIGALDDNPFGNNSGSAYALSISDRDGDQVRDSCDNCPDDFNPDQIAICDCTDIDGDGEQTPPCGNDCNDNDPLVNSGRQEDCLTAVDDDCDGLFNCADSDCTQDGDGDGQAPLPCGTDCDDTDINNFFGNTETCNDQQDNDCDEAVDCADNGCFGFPCDDGFSCTTNDQCGAPGICVGFQNDSACSDGFFCNGAELCAPAAQGADAAGCVPGSNPCPGQSCSEARDECQPCALDPFETDDACNEARRVALPVGQVSEFHTLCPGGDTDSIVFTAEEGLQYEFWTSGLLNTRGTLHTTGCASVLATNDDCNGTDPNFCLTWVATFSGDVVLQVDSPSLDSGDYFLFAKKGEPTGGECTPDQFEEDDLCGDARSIVVDTNGGFEDHSICGLGDVDTYVFGAEAGKTYTFASLGTTDVKAALTTPTCSGTLATASSCSQGDPNFCLTWSAPSSGLFVLQVQGETSEDLGDYRLLFAQEQDGGGDCTVDVFEPDDPCGSGKLITPRDEIQTAFRSLCPIQDEDYFEMFLDPAFKYSFYSESGLDLRGQLGTVDCSEILASNAACGPDGKDFCITFQPETAGFYSLRVSGEFPTTVGDYQLKYTRCANDGEEPNDFCNQAGQLLVVSTEQRRSASICPGDDIDLYQFEALAGRTYHFRSEGTTDMGGAILDAGCNLFLLKDEDCDGSTENFCLTWTAPASGTYKLGMTGTNRGNYDLVYQEVDAPTLECNVDGREPDNMCTEASVIVPTGISQSLNGSLCGTRDEDTFAFQATAGRTYHFSTSGSVDTRGVLREDACNRVLAQDDCDLPDDLNFCMNWTAPRDGVFFIRIQGFNRDLDIGDYTFHYSVSGP